jgi:glucose-6-phosphate-specific signal transduction histidine kinase
VFLAGFLYALVALRRLEELKAGLHRTRADVTQTSLEVNAAVEEHQLRLEVRDDGIGGADPHGHGLLGIADRAAALGGHLEVAPAPGGGTPLKADLPLVGPARHKDEAEA